ncbi:MAG: S9 family peptidase [Leptothrix sp. (in: Bacteria)]|nr:S9 family peptidase [Leptothrix sp. (in: b-proteobacteria)]
MKPARKHPPRPLNADTLWQLQRLGGLALSPDGRQAVCTVTTPDMVLNRSTSQLWLLPTDSAAPRQLTACGDKDGQAAWSPRGERVAFVAKREQQGRKDATPQLYTIAVQGGEAVRHGDFAPGIDSFKWLPDGRRVVFAAWVWPGLEGAAAQNKAHKAWDERKESGYATSEAYYRHFDHNVPMGRVLHLLLLDLGSGRVTDLFEGTKWELPRDAAGNEVYDVHPDGQRVAFVHDPAAEPLQGNRLALAEIDLRTRRIRALADDVAWDFGAPRYSPDGRRIAMTAANVGLRHTAPTQLAVLAPGAGWQLLAAHWDRSVNTPLRWAADGHALYAAAEDRGRCHLWCYRFADDEVRAVHEGGWVQGFDVAGDTLAVLADSATHPAHLLARDLASAEAGAPRRLERFNDGLLAGVVFGETREVVLAGAGGEPVQMWLVFPPGFDAKNKHPVTHVIHGGPFAAAGDTFSWRWNAHVFAAAGHVIAQLNYHGSSGFGAAFRDSLIGRQGALELQDLEAATDWLLQQRWADAKRVFATGGSYGGFLVAWMNGHVAPGRYRAYVCHAGVFDRIATFSADSYPTRPKDLRARYWEDMAAVLAQSPHARAAHMDTPTLVTHGAQDFRVPDCNGLAYYNTLKARAVDARLLWFPDENHWILKPQNSRRWYVEFAAWLARHGGAKLAPGTAQSARP